MTPESQLELVEWVKGQDAKGIPVTPSQFMEYAMNTFNLNFDPNSNERRMWSSGFFAKYPEVKECIAFHGRHITKKQGSKIVEWAKGLHAKGCPPTKAQITAYAVKTFKLKKKPSKQWAIDFCKKEHPEVQEYMQWKVTLLSSQSTTPPSGVNDYESNNSTQKTRQREIGDDGANTNLDTLNHEVCESNGRTQGTHQQEIGSNGAATNLDTLDHEACESDGRTQETHQQDIGSNGAATNLDTLDHEACESDGRTQGTHQQDIGGNGAATNRECFHRLRCEKCDYGISFSFSRHQEVYDHQKTADLEKRRGDNGCGGCFRCVWCGESCKFSELHYQVVLV